MSETAKTKLSIVNVNNMGFEVRNAKGKAVFESDYRQHCEAFVRKQELRAEAVKSAAKHFTSSGPMDVSDKD